MDKLVVDWFEDGEDLKPELEKDKEDHIKEVVKELEDRSELIITEDFELEEALPKDLARAYGSNRSRSYSNIDFKKANYTEISKEDALKAVKAGEGKKLRIIGPNDKLVLLNASNNYRSGAVNPDLTFTGNGRTNVGWDYKYTTRTGRSTSDTAYMPVKHIIEIAKKIYYTDEDSVFVDSGIRKERKLNPESSNFSLSDFERSYEDTDLEYNGLAVRGRAGANGGYATIRGELNGGSDGSIYQAKKYLKRKEDAYQRYLSDQDASEWRVRNAKDSVDYARNELNREKDARARMRYLNSEKNLSKVFDSFRGLKDKLSYMTQSYDRAAKDLDRVKTQGSPEAQRLRSGYEDALAELRRLQAKIAKYEFELEDIDESNAEAVAQAQKKVDNYLNDMSSIKSRLDSLKNRRKTEQLSNNIETFKRKAKFTM